MTDERLKRARARTLALFAEELDRGTPYGRATALALDGHFEAARHLCPSIERELAAIRREMEAKHPPPLRDRSPPVHRPANRPAAPSRPGQPRPSAPSDGRRAGPTAAPETPSAPAPRSAPMTNDRLEAARAATIAAFEHGLRRGTPRGVAIEAALDGHYERVDRLCGDPDAELDAMEAILVRHVPAAPASADRRPSRQKGQPRPRVEDRLLTSPFRFVDLNDRVTEAEPEVLEAGLAQPLADGLCGSITVTWVAETPILIGEEGPDKGSVVPMTMGRGAGAHYVIPGATIRGCLRAAMEIVAAGRLAPINGHARFGLRDFDHPRIRPPGDENASLLARDKVKAGWLSCVIDKETNTKSYKIVPCETWKTIAVADLPFRKGENQYEWRAEWLRTKLRDRYSKAGFTVHKDWIDFEKGGHTREFAQAPEGSPGDLLPRKGGPVKGVLVFSNRSPAAPTAAVIQSLERQGRPGQPKKREYVFIGSKPGETITIDADSWTNFELINSRIFRNKRVPDGSWKELEPTVRAGKPVPVFYIEDKDGPLKVQFGLTRFFKVSHVHSVEEVRDRLFCHRRPKVGSDQPARIDFVEALFGHVLEPGEALVDTGSASKDNALERKGRLAFGFATVADRSTAVPTDTVETVMAAPRASFAPFYLKGLFKDWSASDREGTMLAGRKRYLPRFPQDQLAGAWDNIRKELKEQIDRLTRSGGKVSEDMKSRLGFLRPADPAAGIPFTGRIRLHNVSPVELGALLWVLTHGGDPAKPFRHMMGRGKPFGAGQLRVQSLTLDLKPNHTEQYPPQPAKDWERLTGAGTSAERGWLTDTTWSMEPFLQAFHDHMTEQRKTWPRTRDMLEFLAVSDPGTGARLAKDGRLAYPELKSFAEIRGGGKLSTRFAPPDDRRTRFLPGLADGDAERHAPTVTLPYRDRTKT